VYGVNYWETFAPVVKWTTIRLLITLIMTHEWKSRQLDFILAYPQADAERDIYMRMPKGFKLKDGRDHHSHVLKLIKNIYGLKQAGRVWNQHLHKGLIELGYRQSKIDPCLYYQDRLIMIIYTDDCIMASKNPGKLENAVIEMSKKFEITDEGKIDEYLGVKVQRNEDGSFELSQQLLIEQILTTLGFNGHTKPKTTPALSSKILQRDEDGPDHETVWDYRRIIGQLNFLEKSSRPDIAYAVHQCARFAANPMTCHKHAILRIGRYLMNTKHMGMTMRPNNNPLELWCDADFCGNWDQLTAGSDRSMSKSRTGIIITYAGCPLTWSSRMQTETALSTTEAKFIAHSD